MADKLITVIIPVYNVEEYLRRCFESVIAQNYEKLEIIAVDDGSTDQSGKICDEYALKDNRIHIIHKENAGLGEARNSALDIMRGDYIFFVDSDDYIFPGIIKKLLKACEANEADIACCGYQSGKKTYYRDKKEHCFSAVEATERMFCNNGMDGNAVCKLYKAYLFRNIRYPDCAHEVIPVTYRVFLSAKKIVNTGEVGYYIEKRDGSITRGKFGKNNLVCVQLALQVYENIKHENLELVESAWVFYLNSLITMAERAADAGDTKESIEREEVLGKFEKYYNDILHNKEIAFRKKMIAVLIKKGLYNTIHRNYIKLRG